MIEVQHVSKRFGRVAALTDVSLHIAAGERVALVGTNGSGKTTLLRAMCGLLRTEGRITLGGIDVARDTARALRDLAYMPQLPPPLEAPVAELVRAYCCLRGTEPTEVARLSSELGLSLPAMARTRVRDLSGGMKQKLLAALTLSSRARVLVCDEPTASLDSAARARFFELVKARPADSVLVLCSHRADEVEQLVGRVVELADGRVVHDAAKEEPARAHEGRDEPTLRLIRPADKRMGGVR
ncbi:MAG TPA: ABC transporter ATP-binding protein [Polyangiales bacterium]